MKQPTALNILIKTLTGNKKLLLLTLLTVPLVAAVSLVPPQLMRLLIDRHLITKNLDGMETLAFLYLLVLVLTGGLDFFKGYLLTKLGGKTLCSLRLAMMEKLFRIRARYFKEHAAGETASRFTTDAESVGSLFTDGAVGMLVDGLKIIGILLSICLFSARLALIALLVVPLIAVVTRAFQRRMRKAQADNLSELAGVNAHILESVSNARTIGLFARERYMENRYTERLIRNYATKRRVNFFDASYAPVIQMIRSAAIAVTAILASRGGTVSISAGMLAAGIELLTNLLTPIEALGMELQNIQQGLSGAKRIDGFLALDEDERDESLTAKQVLKSAAAVEFSDVSFAYEKGVPVLSHLDCTVSPRERVTFTGRTGVGKSTLFQLVMGLLSPDGGRVKIGSADAYAIPDREKRKIFGYVEQSFAFVPGTLRTQITLGDPGISDERVWAALKIAGLDAQAAALPDGLDTPVGDGEMFSFGQRQLLAVARAVAADPPILLLDEVTANLDSVTEQKLEKALTSAAEGRTILSIAHRAGAICHGGRTVELRRAAALAAVAYALVGSDALVAPPDALVAPPDALVAPPDACKTPSSLSF